MKYTKEEITQKVQENDTEFFYQVYDDSYANKGEVKIVYDENWGDGNDYYIALHFLNLDCFVLLSGAYSSWDSPSWDSAKFAEPYEYTETRYKPVTLAYMRDKKIKDVLNDETN